MNYRRIVLAAIAAFLAYFLCGTLIFTLPGMKAEYSRFPAVYRSAEGIQSLIPVALASTFIAMLAVAAMYAKGYEGGSGAAEGARFGALVGIFAVCTFVLHNYVNLNIGLRLTLVQGVCYFFEWIVVGIVLGLVYKPAAASSH